MNDAPGLLEDGEREAIEAALAVVEKARGSDHTRSEAIEDLDHASKPFATRRMNARSNRDSAAQRRTPSTRSWEQVEGRHAQVRFEPTGSRSGADRTSILEASNKAHAQVGQRARRVACSTCHVYVKQG